MCIGGFSYQNGNFKWTSRSANHNCDCPCEQRDPIERAVRNYWEKGQQDTKLCD